MKNLRPVKKLTDALNRAWGYCVPFGVSKGTSHWNAAAHQNVTPELETIRAFRRTRYAHRRIVERGAPLGTGTRAVRYSGAASSSEFRSDGMGVRTPQIVERQAQSLATAPKKTSNLVIECPI